MLSSTALPLISFCTCSGLCVTTSIKRSITCRKWIKAAIMHAMSYEPSLNLSSNADVFSSFAVWCVRVAWVHAPSFWTWLSWGFVDIKEYIRNTGKPVIINNVPLLYISTVWNKREWSPLPLAQISHHLLTPSLHICLSCNLYCYCDRCLSFLPHPESFWLDLSGSSPHICSMSALKHLS